MRLHLVLLCIALWGFSYAGLESKEMPKDIKDIEIKRIEKSGRSRNSSADKWFAVVYDGPGASKDCVEKLAYLLRRSGFRTQIAYPGQISKALSRATILAIPGGEDEEEMRNALLKSKEYDLIANFVSAGGHYIGVCAGAYLTGTFVGDSVDDGYQGLGLIPGSTNNRDKVDKEARAELILWQGKTRKFYFQDGPNFFIDEKRVEIWGRYSDGLPAAFIADFGRGRVAVIGVHPEVDDEWRIGDGVLDAEVAKNSDAGVKFIQRTVDPAPLKVAM
ncbi:MAG: hypothetical protein HQK53_08450 [Oligoflexia bacterium]|nr:hypothetical protein [Oligoflexia bacterium]